MMSMSKLRYLFASLFIILFISGCSTMGEGLSSQTEVPTLENQINRVAISMTIIRENNLMAFKTPISSDTTWPSKMASDLNDSCKKNIGELLMYDPYYATVHFTMPIQRKMLKSGYLMEQFGDYGFIASVLLNQKVSPLTYDAMNKIVILYGKNPENWPHIYNYDNSFTNFLEFNNGKLLDIESPKGDIYETIGEALISLTPINLQKDLLEAREEMLYAYEDVTSEKSTKGELETKIQLDEANRKKGQEDTSYVYTPISFSETKSIKQQIKSIDIEIERLEDIANEKELIYFQLLESATFAIENDLDLDDLDKVNLAKNINIVAEEIQSSSTDAYVLFGLALTNIVSNNLVLEFPRELESLAYAKIAIPFKLQDKYNERLIRLAKNALYVLPNIFMGTYYAHKQSTLAEKYEEFTNIIIDAYELKTSQEALASSQHE